ncbi:hypothetical protein ES707_21056 [subsurface metagenome]
MYHVPGIVCSPAVGIGDVAVYVYFGQEKLDLDPLVAVDGVYLLGAPSEVILVPIVEECASGEVHAASM